MASTRSAALRLYRQMLKTAKTWEAVSAAHTQEEQQYIVDEARRLFRQNKTLTGEDVDAALKEAETRLETAVHYRNPYPRLPNVGPGAVSKAKRLQRRQERLREQSTPIYMHSYKAGKTNDAS
eukprot:m.112288 g.112288  ORF g.112288 m.112288 type:complete len:123 (+) comp15320_c0_seq4:73-441(+)